MELVNLSLKSASGLNAPHSPATFPQHVAGSLTVSRPALRTELRPTMTTSPVGNVILFPFVPPTVTPDSGGNGGRAPSMILNVPAADLMAKAVVMDTPMVQDAGWWQACTAKVPAHVANTNSPCPIGWELGPAKVMTWGSPELVQANALPLFRSLLQPESAAPHMRMTKGKGQTPPPSGMY